MTSLDVHAHTLAIDITFEQLKNLNSEKNVYSLVLLMPIIIDKMCTHSFIVFLSLCQEILSLQYSELFCISKNTQYVIVHLHLFNLHFKNFSGYLHVILFLLVSEFKNLNDGLLSYYVFILLYVFIYHIFLRSVYMSQMKPILLQSFVKAVKKC